MKIDKIKELEQFYHQFAPRIYKRGEILIRGDDDPQGIFCLTRGYVRQYTISTKGVELTLHIIKPTSYFPMIWAINGKKNSFYFEALTIVEVERAPREEVINFIKDKPSIMFDLMSGLLEDYAETLMRIEHLVFSDAYQRVIFVLLYIAKHFGEERDNCILVCHRFTQQDIATLVGVVRETASNEMVRLEKKGLITYIDHALLFRDIKKLKAELYSSSSK